MQFQEEQEYTSKFNMGIWKKLFRIAKPFYKYVIAIMLIFVAPNMLVNTLVEAVKAIKSL